MAMNKRVRAARRLAGTSGRAERGISHASYRRAAQVLTHSEWFSRSKVRAAEFTYSAYEMGATFGRRPPPFVMGPRLERPRRLLLCLPSSYEEWSAAARDLRDLSVTHLEACLDGDRDLAVDTLTDMFIVIAMLSGPP